MAAVVRCADTFAQRLCYPIAYEQRVDEHQATRRQMLLAAGAAGTAGIAGCVASPPAAVSRDGGASGYRRWISRAAYDPLGDPQVEFPLWSWEARDVARLRSLQSSLPGALFEQWAGHGGYPEFVGIEQADITARTQLTSGAGWFRVFQGSFDPDRIRAVLETGGYDHVETREGREFHVFRGVPTLGVALGDRAVIQGTIYWKLYDSQTLETDQFVETATQLFETADTPRSQYYTQTDQGSAFVDAAGLGLIARDIRRTHRGQLPELSEFDVPSDLPKDVVSQAAIDYGDEAVQYRLWFWPMAGGDTSPATLEATLERRQSERDAEGDVVVRRQGRATELVFTDPVANPGGGTVPPTSALRLQFDGRTATVSNHAGDPFPMANIYAKAPPQLFPDDGTLGPGESVSVTVPTGVERSDFFYTSGEFDGWIPAVDS